MRIKWRVAEPPTGRYRAFAKRGWPCGEINDRPAVMLRCEDAYVPARVKTGDHAPITIYVADWGSYERGFKWRLLKKSALTLNEAKEIASKFLAANTGFWEQDNA